MAELQLIASIDQGTQSSRVGLYDRNLRVVGSAQLSHTQYFPEAGWAEHDPEEIYQNVLELFKQAVNDAKKRISDDVLLKIVGLGVTNQRETTVAWDRLTGKPLYRAIVWLDTRTKTIVDEMTRLHGGPDGLRAESGLPMTTYFSATKMRWMKENVPEVSKAIDEERCYFGTIDTWLIWRLTGGVDGGRYVTDVTNASRTQLMNIQTCQWSDQLMKVFEIRRNCLPEIKSSAEIYGHVKNVGCPEFEKVPISGCAGDQQAACIGQGIFHQGQVKCTYGTGAFILMNTGTSPVPSTTGLLTTPCYQLGPDQPVIYALEGSIAIAGAAVSWLQNNLNAIKDPKDTEALLTSVPDTAGVYFVPAFSGLFAPRWRHDARGCIMGLSQHTRKAHIVRALVESVGFQLQEIIVAMLSDMGMEELKLVRVDGGMSRNDPFLQITSDLVGSAVERPADPEVTAAGAAIASGLGCGFWNSLKEVQEVLSASTKQWTPQMTENQRQRKIQLWNKAVQRSFNWV